MGDNNDYREHQGGKNCVNGAPFFVSVYSVPFVVRFRFRGLRVSACQSEPKSIKCDCPGGYVLDYCGAAKAMLVAIGHGLNRGFLMVERRVLHWYRSDGRDETA